MKIKGFTLIELLVVIAVLGLILTAILQSYLNILKSYKRETSVGVSNINKLISFELIRRDIESAGFGLSQNYSPIDYNSTTLTLRSTLLLRNDATKCFGYIEPYNRKLFSIEASDITNSDCYNTNFCYVALDLDYNLIGTCYNIDNFPTNDVYLLFGLLDTTSPVPTMPYNEVQYSLSSSNVLSICAPNTYEMVRQEINADGNTSGPQPIFDCVKDFKVGFGLDLNNDGSIDQWSSNLPSNVSDIRTQVKQLVVLILYHEGAKDLNFNFSQGTIYLNATSTLSLGSFTPTGNDLHYRWKVSKLVVRPMNFRRETR